MQKRKIIYSLPIIVLCIALITALISNSIPLVGIIAFCLLFLYIPIYINSKPYLRAGDRLYYSDGSKYSWKVTFVEHLGTTKCIVRYEDVEHEVTVYKTYLYSRKDSKTTR